MHIDKKSFNPCTRCGSQRIVTKTWKERVETYFGSSLVVYTESVCPNIECQKIVNKELEAQRKKRENIKNEREQRTKADKIKKEKLRISKKKSN